MEKIHIIITDDHQLFRNGLKILLNSFPDFEVTGEASNGEEFVNLLKNTKAEIALMDINMPEMDGLAALKEIKSFDPGARVVMLTALGQESVVLQAIKSGARDFVVKPFEKERVLSAISKLLG